MKTKVNVDGYGNFEIDSNNTQELISWLVSHQAVQIRPNNQIREIKDNQFTGRELING